MSRDINYINNDISWLASSPFSSSVAQMPSFQKNYDAETVGNVEPWETSPYLNHVCRNLNKSWVAKPNLTRENGALLDNSNLEPTSINLSENKSSLTQRDSYLQEHLNSNSIDKQSQNWSYLETCSPKILRGASAKYPSSNVGSSTNYENAMAPELQASSSHSCNSLHQLLNLDLLTPEMFKCLTPGSLCNGSFSEYFQEDKNSEKTSFPISPMDSLSPPTTSGTPTKLNTDLIALMQELALVTNEERNSKQYNQNVLLTPFQSPPPTPSSTPTKGCVFCKNNSYHSTFYKSHVLKDDNGVCKCPVLRTYICPLCGGTGDSAHTLKYCPRNTVTKGDPIAAGLPPGKVTNWREVANKMASHQKY